MKKITTLLAIVCLSFAASAQYYYYSFVLAGQNPNGLNTDAEQPAQAGWTSIQGTSATPVWSTTQTLPFTFSLNGTPFTSYKVSTSGILTFTTSAVSVPSSTSATLPNATIPDNSICVWGMAGIGANDAIMVKTFGTAPNRQYWVQFNSYSAIGSTGSNWTYWGIVLEETTNKVYIVDQRTFTTPIALSLGIQVNSSTAYSVTGSPTITSYTTLAGNLDDPSDNSYYEFVPGTTMPVNDARLTSLTNQIYVATPGNVSITGTITNYGSATITSIPVKYQSGANVYSSTISTNITTTSTVNFTHSVPLSIPTPGVYPVKVWVELAGDNNHLNDSLTTTVYGAAFMPSHNVVMEEATGTWCGWCPRGAVFMDSLAVAYPTTFIPIAVHSGSTGEPMRNATYGPAVEATGVGYPTIFVDRKYQDDPSNGFAQYSAHVNDFGLADLTVSVNYNSTTRVAQTSATVNPAITITGTYRLAAVYTEDNVTGTGDGTNNITSDYDQEDYYSFQSNNLPLVGAGHDWQAETQPVPATNMQFDFVARNIQGGYTGQAGSLPASLTAGTPVNYTFANYTIPANYNVANMKVHVLLIDVTNNVILNGKTWTGFPTGVPVTSAPAPFNVNVYPNPANNLATITFQLANSAHAVVTVTNVMGQVVYQNDLGAVSSGLTKHSLNTANLPDGIYNVTLQADGKLSAHKFVISR